MREYRVEIKQNLSWKAAASLAEIIMIVHDIKTPVTVKVISPLRAQIIVGQYYQLSTGD
ncbi:hypothetical protein ABEW24_21135 [Paenibacillus jamilae]|uniref:hypothetical protein n=1 Tax=Paenibacillus TaxID=44249 RepID=UPI000A50489E|nr:hypothetical protein [Paenibacillus polymyxa]